MQAPLKQPTAQPAPPAPSGLGGGFAWPTFTGATARYALEWGVGLSLTLHALLLSIHFVMPDPDQFKGKSKGLEVVLVNSRHAQRPDQADLLAQTNLDGGGNVDKNRRAKTPLPASATTQSGDELEQAESRVREMEAKQQRLLAAARSKESAAPKTGKEAKSEQNAPVSGRDLANSALAMARLQGEIDRNTDEYNKRPRKKFIGARTEEYRFAQYIEDWRLKVERVGTLNYPEAAKGKLFGSLIMSVTARSPTWPAAWRSVSSTPANGTPSAAAPTARRPRTFRPNASWPAPRTTTRPATGCSASA